METKLIRQNTAIQIDNSHIIQQLPIGLQVYVKVKQAPIISQMPLGEAIQFIFDTIEKTLVNLAWPKVAGEEDVIINTSENLFKLICDKYINLTTEELKLACLNGSLENYGKYIGLGLKTLSDWLKGYSNDELKKKAMSEWNKMIDLVQIRNYSDVQKEQIIIDGCLHFFKEYKLSGMLKEIVIPVDSLCAIFYDKLKEKNLLVFTTERKVEIFTKAEKQYKQQVEVNYKKRLIKKDGFEHLMNSMANNSNKPFSNLCKKLALIEYFNDLIEMEQDLDTLLK